MADIMYRLEIAGRWWMSLFLLMTMEWRHHDQTLVVKAASVPGDALEGIPEGIPGDSPGDTPVRSAREIQPRVEARVIVPKVLNIASEDPHTVHHLSRIIESLEALGALDNHSRRCYSLDRVEISPQPTDNTQSHNSWRLGIFLHVRELVNGKGRPAGSAGQETGSDNTPPGGDQPADGKCLGNPSDVILERMTSPPVSEHLNNSAVGVTDMVDSSSGLSTAGDVIVAGGKKGEDDDKDGGGLSYTQLLVISTCSTVIGVFFVLAMVLRLRNYLKRRETTQQPPKRCAYRSSSVGKVAGEEGSTQLQNSAESSQVGLNKKEDEISTIARTGSQYSSFDGKPLLVITSASAPSSPSSSRHNNYVNPQRKQQNGGQPHMRTSSCPARRAQPEYRTYPTQSDRRQSQGTPGTHMDNCPDDPNMVHPCLPSTDVDIDDIKYSATPTEKSWCKEESAYPGDPLVNSDVSSDHTVQRVPEVLVDLPFYSLGGAVLTQSDSSIESNANPSYCYGNQTEYRDGTEDVAMEPTIVSFSPSPNPPRRHFPLCVSYSVDQARYLEDDINMMLEADNAGPSSESVTEEIDKTKKDNSVEQNVNNVEPSDTVDRNVQRSDTTCGAPQITAAMCVPVNSEPTHSGQDVEGSVLDTNAAGDNNAGKEDNDAVNHEQATENHYGDDTHSSLKNNVSTGGRAARKSVTFSLADLADEETEQQAFLVSDADTPDTTEKDCNESTFLLGDDFDGMEPTYV